jgi:hypothetical protein
MEQQILAVVVAVVVHWVVLVLYVYDMQTLMQRHQIQQDHQRLQFLVVIEHIHLPHLVQ